MIDPEKEFVMPLIHLNGSGRERLLREYEAASETLSAFIESWRDVTFHPRDYYPLGDSAWDQARADRMEMSEKLSDIKNYIDTHLQSIFSDNE
jgi:hypothetical protein